MDINPTILFLLIFLLAPLIEKLLKAGKQPPPPPQQRPRPQQRVPPQQRPRPELERPAPAGQRESEEASAADMVPDDLWAILTGEQRPRPTPPPRETAEEQSRQPVSSRPAPPPVPTAKRTAGAGPAKKRPSLQQPLPPIAKRPARGYDMRGELPPDEEASFRRVPPPERAPVEDYVREIPRHAPPEIVSLEELVIDDVKRHETFHDRLAALPRPEVVRQAKRHALAQRFRASDELRHAIIMSEVLGPPRGLD